MTSTLMTVICEIRAFHWLHGQDANFKARAIVKRSDSDQRTLRGFIEHAGKLSPKEKAALNVHSVPEFRRFWTSTLDAKKAFENSHSHGVGLAGKQFQSVASYAVDILQNMDPLIQIIKDFGAPYGGMAIGTISLLFAVCTSERFHIRSSLKLVN
jgi:hypothetical protein